MQANPSECWSSVLWGEREIIFPSVNTLRGQTNPRASPFHKPQVPESGDSFVRMLGAEPRWPGGGHCSYFPAPGPEGAAGSCCWRKMAWNGLGLGRGLYESFVSQAKYVVEEASPHPGCYVGLRCTTRFKLICKTKTGQKIYSWLDNTEQRALDTRITWQLFTWKEHDLYSLACN